MHVDRSPVVIATEVIKAVPWLVSELCWCLVSHYCCCPDVWGRTERKTIRTGENGGGAYWYQFAERGCNSELCQAINNVAYQSACESNSDKLPHIDPIDLTQTHIQIPANRHRFCRKQRADLLQGTRMRGGIRWAEAKRRRLKVIVLTCRVLPRKCPGPAVPRIMLENKRRGVNLCPNYSCACCGEILRHYLAPVYMYMCIYMDVYCIVQTYCKYVSTYYE